METALTSFSRGLHIGQSTEILRPRHSSHTPYTARVQSRVVCGSLDKSKKDLLLLVSPTKRGKSATPTQQLEILQKAQSLEKQNPTRDPVSSPLLSGRWSLLYVGPGAEGDVTWEKRTGGVEGPVLYALQPLAGNLVENKGITQIIDKEAGTVENLAEFVIGGSWKGYLNVEGTVKPSQDRPNRVDVAFIAFSIKVGPLPELKLPLSFISPTGWVETTFLDEDLRIGRGDKGSIFVTARQKTPGRQSEKATESIVSAA